LLVWEYAVALMRVTLGVFQGSTREVDFINSKTGSRGFDRGTADGNVSMGVSSSICAVLIARKRCCPIPSQSRDCSG